MSHKKIFQTKKVAYSYRVIGEGPPLLLLHGFTGTWMTWRPFIDQWKNHFQCIAIDLPGHGETKAKEKVSMEECCSNLAKLLEKLKINPVHILGYSMGGRVALSFSMMYPSFVQSIILESSSPGLKTAMEREERRRRDENLARKIKTEGIEPFVNDWENIPLFQTQQTLPKKVKQKIRKERLSQTPDGLAQSLQGMGTGAQPSWWRKIDKLNQPTLLIVGAKDKKFVKINKEMEQLLPKVSLEVIPDSGHAIHIEKPDLFNTSVQGFLLEISLL